MTEITRRKALAGAATLAIPAVAGCQQNTKCKGGCSKVKDINYNQDCGWGDGTTSAAAEFTEPINGTVQFVGYEQDDAVVSETVSVHNSEVASAQFVGCIEQVEVTVTEDNADNASD